MEFREILSFASSPERVLRAVRMGLKSLWLHKLRSLLTALGIVFGVASVIAMLAIGEGASEEAQAQIKMMGSQNIIIDSVKPTSDTKQSDSRESFVVKYGVDNRDLAGLEGLPGVKSVVPSRIAREYLENLERNVDGEVVGTLPGQQYLKSRRIIRGRYLSDHDLENHAAVGVIGESTAALLFPAADPVGKVVKVGSSRYRVIGVLEDMGDQPGAEAAASHRMNIPLTTMGDQYGSVLFKRRAGSFEAEEVQYHEVTVRGDTAVSMTALAAAVRQLFSQNHVQQDCRITVPVELLRQAERTKRIFNIVLGSIAAISLLVGGIGIMNIMLASVTERTREIGIRRALGARRGDIIMQFLIETVLLSGIGGLLGVILGVGLPFIITNFTEIRAIIRIWAPTMAFSISVLTGIIFGIYPAIRAAKMSPVEALRHE